MPFFFLMTRWIYVGKATWISQPRKLLGIGLGTLWFWWFLSPNTRCWCSPKAASLIAVFMSITETMPQFRKRSRISVNNQLVSLPVSRTSKIVLFLLAGNNKLIFSVVFQHPMSPCSHFPLISAILIPLLLKSKIFSGNFTRSRFTAMKINLGVMRSCLFVIYKAPRMTL